MKDEDYNIHEDQDYTSAASAYDCTGLVPSGTGKPEELAAYRELYPFGQPELSVGDISDEYDEEEKNYVKLDDNTYIFEGKTVLNDFYKITGLDESEFGDKAEDAETLAGLILDIKEDFPKVKEQIDYGRCSFVVLELDKRRIGKVKVKINPAAPQDE